MLSQLKIDWSLPSSKDPSSLLPEVAEAAKKALANCEKAGFKVLVTQTYRSPKEQEVLYLKGRQGKLGEKIVTNARAWPISIFLSFTPICTSAGSFSNLR